jgi:hypothetical protein
VTKTEFETLLNAVNSDLNKQLNSGVKFSGSKEFEGEVRQAISRLGKLLNVKVDFDPHPHIFPDIVVGVFGVEVKYSDKDTWRSIANSIFEGRRNEEVKEIYLIFGKMGGKPEVRWAKYNESVIHVRTSHVPRFEVEISSKKSLFSQWGVSYAEFQALDEEAKMTLVRSYARGRLKAGERLWWLGGDGNDDAHALELQAKLYTSLPNEEKRKLRAEAAFICPSVVRSSRSKKKYDDAALYLLTYHGVLCTQVRDLFSAGSVALRADDTRGGNYIIRSLQDIEPEMRAVALNLDGKVLVEYWGKDYHPSERIEEWLRRADKEASDGDWTPSAVLFINQ